MGAIRAPVLQIAALGAVPPPLRVAAAARYAAQVAAVPAHELVATDAGYHFVMFDAPTFWRDVLDRFLARVERGVPAIPTAHPVAQRGGR